MTHLTERTDPTDPAAVPAVTTATGERYAFVRTTEQTAGAFLEIEMTLPPDFATGGERHPEQDERIRVLAGQLDVNLSGDVRHLGPGDELLIPRGSAHRPANRSNETTLVDVTLTPALDIQRFFETYAGLSREGKSTAGGVPRNPLQLAVWLHAYRREVRLTGPGAIAQAVVFPPVAALGRLFGYRPHHDRYTAEVGTG